MNSDPNYKHDCDQCIFLGDVLAHHHPVDLYFCPVGHQTIIARYSSEGADYSSGISFGEDGLIAELVVARQRAIDRGLLKKKSFSSQ